MGTASKLMAPTDADRAALEAQKAKVKDAKAAGASKEEIVAMVAELNRLKEVCGEEVGGGKKKKEPKAAAPPPAEQKTGPSKKDLKKAAKKEAKQAGKSEGSSGTSP